MRRPQAIQRRRTYPPRPRRAPPYSSTGWRIVSLTASVRLEALRVVELSGGVRLEVPATFRVFVLETKYFTESELPAGLVWGAPDDGYYLLRVVLDSGVWPDHPCEILRPVLIQDGAPAQSPPIIAAAQVAIVAGGVWVSWRYQRQYGQQDPVTWNVWTGPEHPIDRSGPAAASVPVQSEGIYGVFIAGVSDPVAVVVAT